MRAVNLIPSDQRTGGSVGAGRSGGAAYALLGVLAAVAVLALLYGKASHEISSKKSQAARITAQAAHDQAEANALAPYTTFVALREQRAKAVEELVDSRFDWAHAFHEFGRVLTGQTSITSLQGQIGGATPGASTTPAPATPAAPTATASAASASSVSSVTPPGSVPTFGLTGCATSQRVVAQTLQRLRLIDGVKEVTLQSSTKGSSGGGGSSAGGAGGGCPSGDPSFAMTVTFEPLPSASEAASATSASTVSEKSTTPSAPAAATASSTGGKAG